MSYTFSIAFDFSPGTYIQMGRMELFQEQLFFLSDHWNFPAYVSPPVKLRESLFCPLKGHFSQLNSNHCRNRSNRTLVPRGIRLHCEHPRPCGNHSGILKVKQESIKSSGWESAQAFSQQVQEPTGTQEPSLKMETLAMLSKWSHKRIGSGPASGASFISGLLVAPAAKPVNRLAGQEAPAYLVSGICSRNQEPN